MANYFARKAGNIDATDVWATTPSGTAGAQTFVSGDVLYANSFAITVNVSTNLGSTGEVRNDNTNSATTGGGFTLSNGVTLTANVIQGATATACVTYAGTTGNSATIVGNVTGGSISSAIAVTNTSSGTLNITGNCTGGSAGGASGASNTSTGTLNITGNCVGGSGGQNANGATNSSTGTLNITGNCTGGTSASGLCHGANNSSTGTVNITGNCIGGSNATSGASNIGARNSGAGVLSITGNCTGSSSIDAVGALNASTGQMSVNGSIFATEQASGVGGGVRGQVTRLTGPFYTTATFGVNPNTCLAWRWASTLNASTFIEVPTTNLTSTRNLVTPDNATNFPAASDVRSGVTYGISGALTGTCAVPPAGSVSFGVPVGNTTGTAYVSPADFWGYSLSSAASVAGSVGQKLAKAATPADIVALG